MVFGHQTIQVYLEKSLIGGRLSHAYLFVGPQNIGKTTVARRFIRAIHCETNESFPCNSCVSCSALLRGIFPDTREIIEEGGKGIGIDEVRSLIRFLSLSPGGEHRTVLLEGAERMTIEAANALLKILEEPRGNAVLILTSSDSNRIPRTLRSRCEIIGCRLVPSREIREGLVRLGAGIEDARTISDMSLGRPGIALRIFQDPAYRKTREKLEERVAGLIESSVAERFSFVQSLYEDPIGVVDFLTVLTVFFRNFLFSNVSVPTEISKKYSKNEMISFLRLIQKTRRILSDSTVNRRLALEVLMLSFP